MPNKLKLPKYMVLPEVRTPIMAIFECDRETTVRADLPFAVVDDSPEARAANQTLVAIVRSQALAETIAAVLEDAADERIIVRMMVACHNPNGEPDLFFCKVRCTQDERDAGVCYQVAKSAADADGYGEPFLAFDETDHAGAALLNHFEWETASIVDAAAFEATPGPSEPSRERPGSNQETGEGTPPDRG